VNVIKIAIIAASTLLLVACAGKTTVPQTASIKPKLPSWVLLPVVKNGFADTQCVTTVADMNILKNKATALARAEIAKQINIQIKAMDKTYQNLTETGKGSTAGSTFESVSKQVTQKNLSGSRAVKVDYVDFPDGTQKLCVMVVLDPDLAKNLYQNIVKAAGRKLSPKDNAVLYEEFKAYKAQQELEKATQQ